MTNLKSIPTMRDWLLLVIVYGTHLSAIANVTSDANIANGTTFKLVRGIEEPDDVSVLSAGGFHLCSLNDACSNVVRIKDTNEYKLAEDQRSIDAIQRGLLVWEKVKPENPKQQQQRKMMTCLQLKSNGAASGVYNIRLPSGVHRVYCDMETDGGGFTFLANETLSRITKSDVEFLMTNNRTVLMRILKPNGTQTYTVIRQYTDTGGLSVQVDSHTGYTESFVVGLRKYLMVGVLPSSAAANRNTQGFISNNAELTFSNCDATPNSYFVFHSKAPSKIRRMSEPAGSICSRWRGSGKTSNTNLPRDFFVFTEMHFGGCGCYSHSVAWPGLVNPALGAAIGIR